MEEKLLKIAAEMSVENILKEMRKFSPEPLNCMIMINTHSNPDETDPDKQYDAFYIGMAVNGSEDNFIEEANKVFWHFNPREGEGIRKVEPMEVEQNE